MTKRRVGDKLENRVGKVGEISVALRIRAMGVNVQFTEHGSPLCDLLVGDVRTGRSKMIEVKSSTTTVFTIGQLPNKDERVYVLVSFNEKEKLIKTDEEIGTQDFFVLTAEELAQNWKSNLGRGRKGGVRKKDVEIYQNEWCKIISPVKKKRSDEQKQRDILLGQFLKENRNKYFKLNGEPRKSRTRKEADSELMKYVQKKISRKLQK